MRGGLAFIAVVASVAVAACGTEARPGEGIPVALEPVDGPPPALVTVPRGPVRERVGPGGSRFEVASRTPELEQYPCAACHADGASPSPAREPDVHGDIQPVHPSAAGATCATCHTAEDPARLRAADGSPVGLDDAYLLCAGCHYQEADDWAGGAHGKRLAVWRGQRVVLNCTGCHDPHSPAFPQRIPHPGPRIPRTGGGAP